MSGDRSSVTHMTRHGTAVTIDFDRPAARSCGECTLCCRLLPIAEPGLQKPAGERCEHQCRAGCRVYDRPDVRPASCAMWSCAWLLAPADEPTGLKRPDRGHYVVDMLPDFITARDDNTGNTYPIPVVQVWIDPRHPDAHRDPALRRYLEHRAALDGHAAIIRFNNSSAFILFPPPMTGDGCWHEVRTNLRPEHQHTRREVNRVIDEHARGDATRLALPDRETGAPVVIDV